MESGLVFDVNQIHNLALCMLFEPKFTDPIIDEIRDQ
jgi:hypothetical protein